MPYLHLTGNSGCFATTPDHASFPTGTGAIIDCQIEVEPANWLVDTGPAFMSHGSYSSSLRAWVVGMFSSTAGSLRCQISANAVNSESDISVPTGFAGKKFVRYLINTTAGTLHYYHKNNIGDAWTLLDTDTLTTLGIFNSSEPLSIGGSSSGLFLLTGKVYRAWLYSGDSASGGTLVASPDFSAQTPGETSFVDSTGKTWTLHGDASIVTDTGFIMSSPKSYQVHQRDADNQAIVTIAGTYTGTPTTIEYRLNGGSWATLVDSPSGGSFSQTVTLTGIAKYDIDVRFSNDTGTTASITNVGVGDVIVQAGQSNMSGRGTNNQTYAKTPTGVFAALFQNSNSWAELSDPYDSINAQVDAVSLDNTTPAGSVVPLIARYCIHNQRVPVAFVPCAMGSTSITEWLPGADHLDRSTLYGSMNYRIGLTGGAKFAMWWQGETDATAGMSQATYNGHLDTIANALMADRGIKLMPCVMQTISNGATTEQQNAIRNATVEAWTDNANVLVGPDLSDLTSDDTAHLQTDEKLAIAAERWWVAIEAAFYQTSVGTNTDLWFKLTQIAVDNGLELKRP